MKSISNYILEIILIWALKLVRRLCDYKIAYVAFDRDAIVMYPYEGKTGYVLCDGEKDHEQNSQSH